jgi:hypothetical protein
VSEIIEGAKVACAQLEQRSRWESEYREVHEARMVFWDDLGQIVGAQDWAPISVTNHAPADDDPANARWADAKILAILVALHAVILALAVIGAADVWQHIQRWFA